VVLVYTTLRRRRPPPFLFNRFLREFLRDEPPTHPQHGEQIENRILPAKPNSMKQSIQAAD
jgi:hypothetical protein